MKLIKSGKDQSLTQILKKTLRKKQVNNVLKKTRFLWESVLVNLFTDEIFSIIKTK